MLVISRPSIGTVLSPPNVPAPRFVNRSRAGESKFVADRIGSQDLASLAQFGLGQVAAEDGDSRRALREAVAAMRTLRRVGHFNRDYLAKLRDRMRELRFPADDPLLGGGQ